MNTTYPKQAILCVDDELSALNSFSLILESHGFSNALTCHESTHVRGILEQQPISVLFLDLIMPGCSGEEILEWVMSDFPATQVIVVTGNDDIDTAVRCMRLGAFDYLVKPIEEDRLTAALRKALEVSELRQACDVLRRSMFEDVHPKCNEAFSHIVTDSPAMKKIFSYLEAVSGSRQPILVTGESGTGKELVARAIHALSLPEEPFVSVNVAGLDDTMLSDTLFGHVKGAYTGAMQTRKGMIDKAGSGVLFLDEIGELSLASQVKLLRLLQEREYFPLGADVPRKMNARLVCATNADLEEKVADGTFRRDLYYRIYTHHVCLPPLRDRTGDLALLLHHFVQEAAEEVGLKTPRIDSQVVPLLSQYDFPGNVRELQAMAHDTVSVCGNKRTLTFTDFSKRLGTPQASAGILPPPAISHENTAGTCFPEQIVFPAELPNLEETGNQLVVEAMRRSGDKQTVACRLLGISQPALSKRLKRLRGTGDN